MARVIEELYCQVDGKVYVSRDIANQESTCIACAFNEIHGGYCPKLKHTDRFVCVVNELIWKELEADE